MSRDEQSAPLEMSVKKRFSLRESYWITHDAARTFRHFLRFRAGRDERYTSRIMLAVTEVNGCAVCAFAHTKLALEAGMDLDEVRQLLGGVTSGAPDRELPALAFAQHYADTRAQLEAPAWERLVEVYGEQEALGVLGATRMMMWGNAVGIPLSLLRARLHGRPQRGSSLPHEIGTALGVWLVLPVALVHAAISTLRREPLEPVYRRGRE